MKNYGIILASGTGERSGLDIPKQFVKIAGKTVLEHTLLVFQNSKSIDEIIVVTNPNYIDFVQEIVNKAGFNKVIKIVAGGATRRESSAIGLNAIEEDDAKVLIHDAVRPFLASAIIEECVKALDKYKAVDVAIPSADTIIKVKSDNTIEEIPQRKYLKRGQTPQAFDLKTIKEAHRLAQNCSDISVTDDCGLILKFNLGDVYVVKGDDFNIKITYPLDVAIADKLFQLKTSNVEGDNLIKLKDKVIIVFGGTRGIGESICNIAKNHGAKVYGYSRANGVDITDYKTVEEALKNVFEKEGRIDYIINTAGVLKFGGLKERDIDDIRQEAEINYFGCINIAKSAFEYLKQTQGGLLYFSSSSYTRGRKNYSIYSSTKAAVVNLTQALAEEWEYFGIKVNVIVPERTATPMRYENFGKEPKETLLEPDVVAQKALDVLLSDDTAQVVNVSNSEINFEIYS